MHRLAIGLMHPAQAMYVIKFVSDLRQVGGFLLVLRFPPSIKMLLKVALNTITPFFKIKKYDYLL
jgi:hypothetical protein